MNGVFIFSGSMWLIFSSSSLLNISLKKAVTNRICSFSSVVFPSAPSTAILFFSFL